MLSKNNRFVTLIALLVLSLQLFPFLLMGTNAFVLFRDNLDSDFLYLHLLKSTGMLFGTDPQMIVPNVMNGLPRVYFHSEFSFIRLWFLLLPSYHAYVFNSTLIHLIGFTGMFLFMRDNFTDGKVKPAALVAGMFALAPLYTMYGLSVAGVPLILWTFQKIQRGTAKIYHYLILILFPFYSHFAMIGPFIIALLFAIAVYRIFLLKQKVPMAWFAAMTLLFCCFLLANFNIISSYIFPSDIPSHRSEWNAIPYSMKTAFKQTVKVILSGHYHSTSFLAIPLYLAGLFALWQTRSNRKAVLQLAIPFIAIAGISLFMALYPFLKYGLKDILHFITTFQLTRFSFLIPVMWFLIIGLAYRYTLKGKPVFWALMIIQTFIIINSNKEIKNNYIHIATKGINTFNFNSYAAVFSEDLCNQIDTYIGKEKSSYRVLSLGLEPNVAIYNGFYTLDSYQNYYPLSYKHAFRKIIAAELEKNAVLKKNFDTWGNRCYLFSSELQKCCFLDCNKNKDCQINHLEIDTNAIRDLGGSYLFSAVPVNNHKELGLVFEKKFTSPSSKYNIYLYKI